MEESERHSERIREWESLAQSQIANDTARDSFLSTGHTLIIGSSVAFAGSLSVRPKTKLSGISSLA
jgi:hypothetical protein